jgi:hypothetical protein
MTRRHAGDFQQSLIEELKTHQSVSRVLQDSQLQWRVPLFGVVVNPEVVDCELIRCVDGTRPNHLTNGLQSEFHLRRIRD